MLDIIHSDPSRGPCLTSNILTPRRAGQCKAHGLKNGSSGASKPHTGPPIPVSVDSFGDATTKNVNSHKIKHDQM